jgi:2-O-methyltransferase
MNSRNISKKIIAQYLPQNPAIIEAGAHIGRDTLKMIKEWPTSIIHAFEPVPDLFIHLSTNVAHTTQVICYPYALSSKTGRSTLFMSSGRSTATSSLLEPTLYKETHPDTLFMPIQVDTITLDDWAQKYNVDHIDGMWLDLQGAELIALQAAPTLLKTVSMIYMEVNFIERYKNMPLYPDIKQWLAKQGFNVELEAFDQSEWGNVLFIRQKKLMQ